MMMRAAIVGALLFAVTAFAEETPKPDYSREGLRRALTVITDDRPPASRNVHWGLGGVEFRAFGMNWRIGLLPLAMPFSGSVRGSNPSSMWPDPFALTGTQFAETPRTWRDNREISRERKRIEAIVRASR